MRIAVHAYGFDGLRSAINAMRPGGRARLNRIGAYAVAAAVQRHIHSYARGKHVTASELGAARTGHYEKGAAAITSDASSNAAEVRIPIPGISRAFHKIDLTTPTRYGKNYLTIPKHAAAYGHTATELKARGWTIFRPGKKLCLLGYKSKGDKPVLLYALAKAVHQRQDPRLLPTQAQLGHVFARSQAEEINRIMRKASR